MTKIHPSAIVGKASLGENVEIGPYSIVEDGAVVGDNCIVEPYARLRGCVKLGKGVRICSYALIGGDPQDLNFDMFVPTFVEIGDGTLVRESSTIHRATFAGQATRVGSNCLLMASSHIGHDCKVADNVILCSFSALAGHVHVDKGAFISGGVMVHQRTRVGEGAFISGTSAVSLDVPPFSYAHARNDIGGINVVGMSRKGFSREEIAEVKSLYFKVYSGGSPRKIAMQLKDSEPPTTRAGKIFLDFFALEGRHYLQPRAREK